MKKTFVAFCLMLLMVLIFVSCSKMDRTALQSALDKSFKEEDYTEDAYKFYKEKYENALAVMNDSGASDSQISSAANELNAAIERLLSNKRADFSSLKQLIDKTFDEAEYTPESYSAYLEAYDAACEVYKDKDSRQSAVNSALKHLNDTINALIKKADISQLEKLLAFEVEEESYTVSSYAYYKKVYDAADELYKKAVDPENKGNLKDLQSNIDLCCKQMNDAISKLLHRANTDKLSSTIQKAESIITGNVEGVACSVYYTEETYNALVEVTENVKAVVAANDADQDFADSAQEKITRAIAALEKSNVRSELYELITTVQNEYLSTREYFSHKSYLNLHSVINDAIDEYNSPTSTPEGIAEAKRNINFAIDALEYVMVFGTGIKEKSLEGVGIKISGDSQSVTLSRFLTTHLNTYFKDQNKEKYIYSSVDDENGRTIIFKDLSEINYKDGTFTLKRLTQLPGGATLGEDELINEKIMLVGGSSLDTSEEVSIVSSIRRNPTEYFERDGKAVLLYADDPNGIILTYVYDRENACIDEITIQIEIDADIDVDIDVLP